MRCIPTGLLLASSDMPLIGSYRDLDVWRVSMDLVDEVLKRVKTIPRR